MKISAARQAAFGILMRVETDNAYSTVLLDSAAHMLAPNDRGLCHELTLGTLRRQIWLDHVIGTLTKGRKLDVEVRVALRLGLYQLRFLDKIPAYSAINESVQLVQFAGKTSAKPLVNAVLRRAQRGVEIAEPADLVAALELATSHPRWLLEKWIGDHGFDSAAAIAHANNELPPIAFRTTAASTDAAGAAIRAATRSRFADGCFLASTFDDGLSELAAKHEIYFQDEGSQIVGNCVPISGAKRVLDACAAPGSKTTLIAKRLIESGNAAALVAGDRYASRMRALRSNCDGQGLGDVRLVQYDAEVPLPFADDAFDSVLVDAPCTGTGTIRRNPEIRYRVRPDDLIELPRKQLAMLTNASKIVARGGNLIYSTCSIEPEENEAVRAGFLENSAEFEPVPPAIDDRLLTAAGFGRTFPHRDGMDGFFIAAFRRR